MTRIIWLGSFVAGAALWFCAVAAQAGVPLTVIYSGNLDGELEPCGCSEEGNFGGIKRQVSLVDQLRKENPELILVSSGGLLANEGAGDMLKSEYILRGFASLGYDAIGVQWRDLSYGEVFLRAPALPWVSANWRTDTLPSVHRFTRAGRAVSFFAWLDPGQAPERQMQGDHSLITESPARLTEQILAARAKGDLVILSTTLAADAVQKLVPLEAVDILVARSAYEVFGEPRMIGKTLVLVPGSRGMRLGRVDLRLDDQGRIAGFQHAVLPMPTTVPDAPRMAAWYDEYNAKVKADYLKRVEIRKGLSAGTSPFVGEEGCQECHVDPHATWVESRHAKAYDDLERVNKSFDPSCLQCHTVGFDKTGGFIDLKITPQLLGVQCESCHGAGRQHVVSAGAKPLANTGWPAARMCAQCHTQPHSPLFDLDAYWPKIEH